MRDADEYDYDVAVSPSPPAATGGWTPALCSSPLHSAGLSMDNPFEMFDEVGRSLKWFNLPRNTPPQQHQGQLQLNHQQRAQFDEEEASYDSDSSSIGSYFSKDGHQATIFANHHQGGCNGNEQYHYQGREPEHNTNHHQDRDIECNDVRFVDQRRNVEKDSDHTNASDEEVEEACNGTNTQVPVQIVLPPRCPPKALERPRALPRKDELYSSRALEAAGDPVSGLVRSFFGSRQQDSRPKPEASSNAMEGELASLKKQVEVLEDENTKYRKESQRINKLLKEKENDIGRLAQEKTSWQRIKESEMQAFRDQKEELMQQLRREKRLLEKQTQCMLQFPNPLPNKKERREIADLKAKLVDVHEEHLKKEARLRLTNIRLRKLAKELSGRLNEKQDEIKRYEKLLSEVNPNKLRSSLRGFLDEEKKKSPKEVDCCVRESASVGCRITAGLFHQRSTTDSGKSPKTKKEVHIKGRSADPASCIDEEGEGNKQSGVTEDPKAKVGGMNECPGRKGTETETNANTNTDESTEEQQKFTATSTNKCTKGDLMKLELPTRASLQEIASKAAAGTQRRSMLFPDGTREEEYVDGLACIYFPNGDIKNSLADGTTEYYYSEIDTWHTTKPNGVEVFYFPHNQVEEHWPNGRKKVIYPDGSSTIIEP